MVSWCHEQTGSIGYVVKVSQHLRAEGACRDVSDCADWLVDKLSGMGFEAVAHKTHRIPSWWGAAPGRKAGRPC